MNAVPSWAEGIRAVHEQADGLLDLEVVRPTEMVSILGAALAGDPGAEQTLTMLAGAASRIEAASRTRRPSLCGSCPRPLRNNKFAFVVARPSCDGPMNAVILTVCRRCATSRAEVEAKAIVALRRLWPDVRPISVTHPGGGRA